MPVWISSAISSVPYLRHSAAAPGRNSSVGMLTPLPWIGSTMKAATSRDDSALLERGKIVERDRRAARQQRLEPAAEIRIVGQRQRAIGKAVERMRAVNDARPAGGAARELDRGFDGFGAGIGKKHLVQIWDMLEQPFGQHAGKRGDVELHEIRQIGIEHAFQRMAQRRMVAAYRKNAKSAQ